jgi:D-alanine-D-alanine ligase-like ATP-grasp enzyme
VRVINRVEALMNAHDKLRTARLLTGADLPHPKTAHITSLEQATGFALPVVVKPRFGSWGTDVFRCETGGDLMRTLAAVSSRPWFVRHGALVQELVPPRGTTCDLSSRRVRSSARRSEYQALVSAYERLARRDETPDAAIARGRCARG